MDVKVFGVRVSGLSFNMLSPKPSSLLGESLEQIYLGTGVEAYNRGIGVIGDSK